MFSQKLSKLARILLVQIETCTFDPLDTLSLKVKLKLACNTKLQACFESAKPNKPTPFLVWKIWLFI